MRPSFQSFSASPPVEEKHIQFPLADYMGSQCGSALMRFSLNYSPQEMLKSPDSPLEVVLAERNDLLQELFQAVNC